MKNDNFKQWFGLVVAALALAVTVQAQNGVWTNTAGGSWANAVNWTNGVIATNTGYTADFSQLILPAAKVVTLDGARTIGNLTLGDLGNTYGWTLNTGSAGPLTLAVNSGSPVVTINGQTNTIGAVIAGTQGLTKAGAGSLNLTGASTYSGTTLVSAGTLILGGSGGGSGPIGGSAIVVTNGAVLQLNGGDVLGYSTANPLTVYGTVTKTYAQEETLYRPITLSGGVITNTFTSNSAPAYELFGNYIGTAAGTTNYIAGNGPFGLRTATTYFTNAPGSVLNVAVIVTNYVGAVGQLNKYGAGTTILYSNNTYTGSTVVGGGTLVLSGAGSISNSSIVQIVAGAALQLNGVSQTFTNVGGATAFSGGSIAGGSATTASLTINNPGVVTNACAIGGTNTYQNNLALLKGGAGQLFLPGVLTYTNNTTITAGTVVAGALTNADGATLSVVDATGTLSATNLALGTLAGSFVAITGFTGATAPVLATNLTTAGTNYLSLTGTPATGVDYPVIKYGTLGGAGFGSFHLLRGMFGYVSNNAANSSVDVVLSNPNIYPLAWQGNLSAVWDVNTSSNWVFNGTPNVFLTGDNVQLDDTAVAVSTNLVLNMPVSPLAVTVTNNVLNYTISGSGMVAGGGGLTKDGTASLTLLTTNSYTGQTVINGGTVYFSNIANGGLACALGAASNNATNLVVNGGTLFYTGRTNSTDRAVTIGAAGGAINVQSNLTENGVIAGAGVLAYNGPGQLTLSVDVTLTNGVAVNGGTLALAAGNISSSTLAACSSLTINSGGTVQLNSDNSLAGGGSPLGTLPVIINAGGVLTGLASADSGAGTSSHIRGLLTLNGGTLADSGTENQTAFGTWDLDDGVVVSGGTNVSTIACLDVVPSQSGGTVFNVAAGGTPSGVDLLVSGTLIKGNGVIKSGNGVMALTGTNTYAGSTIINAGTLALSGSGSISNTTVISLASNAVFNVSGLSGAFTLGSSQTLTNAAGSAGILNGSVNTGSGTVSLAYAASPVLMVTNGTLTLSGSTGFKVSTGTALTPGSYELIGTNIGGVVAGTLPAVTLAGLGSTAGTTAALAVSGGQLYLVVSAPVTNTLVLLTGSNPSTYGTVLAFQATLSPAPTNGETVTFWDGATTLGAGSLAGGVATLTTSALGAGAHSITAVYGGDGYYAASTSGVVSQSVNAAMLTVTARNTNEAYVYGMPAFSGGNGVTYAGFVNGQTNTVLGGALAYGGTSQGATNAGIYTIVPSGLTNAANPNYTIGYVNGALTISQATPVITLGSSLNPAGYLAGISFTATLQANATGSVVFSSANGPISTNMLSGGAAGSASITNLARGVQVIAAVYSGDSNYLPGTNTFNQTITNHPPVAAVMAVFRTAGFPLEIALSDIATNWTDADGDPVELTAVDLTTTNGVTLYPIGLMTNLDGSYVVTNYMYLGYVPSAEVADQISYSIKDGQGGTNIGYINIMVVSSVTGTNSITMITGGNPNGLTAYGIPGFTYITERSTNLTDWVKISTNTAAMNGAISVADSFSDLGGSAPSAAYYRLLWLP